MRNQGQADAAHYREVAEYAEKKVNNWLREVDLFWALQAASARRNLGDYAKSNAWFDVAEKQYKAYNEDDILDTALSGIASILINDQAVAYKGEVYDGVLMNTYKAMNYMALADYKSARVEFNRALDRQRRAKITFAQEIKLREKELASNKDGKIIKKTMASSETKAKLKCQIFQFSCF